MPSIPTLLKVAAGLGVRATQLFEPDAPSTRVVRKAERRIYDYKQRGFQEAIISTDENNMIELAWAVIKPDGGTGPELFTHGSTSECVYVLRGELEVIVDDEPHALRSGDCLTFPGSCRHGCTNRTSKPAEILWITSPPTY